MPDNFWDFDPSTWMNSAADAVNNVLPSASSGYADADLINEINQMGTRDLNSVLEQFGGSADGYDFSSPQQDQSMAWMRDANNGGFMNQLKNAVGLLTQPIGGNKAGMSVAGGAIGALTALSQYINQKKLAKLQSQAYNKQMAWADEDRASAMAQRAQQAQMNAPFDTSIQQRNYTGVDPTRMSSYGKLDRSTGKVYAPVMYDKSMPTVTITPRAVDPSVNVLNKASGGSVPGCGSGCGPLGLLRGKSGGQDDVVPVAAAGGEYVMDADTVASLGDGNTEAGAAKLDQMRQEIRKHKRSAPASKIPPKAKSPLQYVKGGK